MENLKAYQLKGILSDYLESGQNVEKFAYKSKKKSDLINLIKAKGIDLSKYQILQENPYKPEPNIYKKFGTKKYSKEQQEQYEEEENKDTRIALVARKSYISREGVSEMLQLQSHQVKFIKQFIYSNLQGAVMFHGVGSGKTLTAVVSAYWYLKVYPQNRIIVISPSALIYNFMESMIKYGISVEDNRYTFITFDKYMRKPIIADNALLIVDEAHNMRTDMQLSHALNPETLEEVGYVAKQNKRGFSIWQNGALRAHKTLLLTGTMFVNTLLDAENLLAMIDQRPPLSEGLFSSVISSPSNIMDHFSYRVSYFESPKSAFFPTVHNYYEPCYMTDEMEKKYNYYKTTGIPDNDKSKKKKEDGEGGGGGENAFFSAERYASNMVVNADGINPKVQWIITEINKKKNQKFIIYSGLYDNGAQQIRKQLDKEGIKFKQITGRENARQKEDAKLYYNHYNFGRVDFFKTMKNTDENHKYINSEYRILLITRAGAEGVDTTNTQNMIIMDHQFNDALSQQIIARAVRFKSHFGLPEKERYVNVYRIFLSFESEKPIFELIKIIQLIIHNGDEN